MNLVSDERKCDCLLGNNTVTKEAFISYCPKHAAAPALFEALVRRHECGAYYRIKAALKLATGGDEDE